MGVREDATDNRSTDGYVMMALGPAGSWGFGDFADPEVWKRLAGLADVALEDIDDFSEKEEFHFEFGSEELDGALVAYRCRETVERLVRCAEESPEALPFNIA